MDPGREYELIQRIKGSEAALFMEELYKTLAEERAKALFLGASRDKDDIYADVQAVRSYFAGLLALRQREVDVTALINKVAKDEMENGEKLIERIRYGGA